MEDATRAERRSPDGPAASRVEAVDLVARRGRRPRPAASSAATRHRPRGHRKSRRRPRAPPSAGSRRNERLAAGCRQTHTAIARDRQRNPGRRPTRTGGRRAACPRARRGCCTVPAVASANHSVRPATCRSARRGDSDTSAWRAGDVHERRQVGECDPRDAALCRQRPRGAGQRDAPPRARTAVVEDGEPAPPVTYRRPPAFCAWPTAPPRSMTRRGAEPGPVGGALGDRADRAAGDDHATRVGTHARGGAADGDALHAGAVVRGRPGVEGERGRDQQGGAERATARWDQRPPTARHADAAGAYRRSAYTIASGGRLSRSAASAGNRPRRGRAGGPRRSLSECGGVGEC